MKENIDKYDNEIKGFNIRDNKINFFKDLQEFIEGLNKVKENENDMMMDLDTDEENKSRIEYSFL